MDHPVEISGWDAVEEFFVEWSVVKVQQRSRCMLYLRHLLGPDAWLFVRRSNPNSSPVPLRVISTDLVANKGLYRVLAVRAGLKQEGASKGPVKGTDSLVEWSGRKQAVVLLDNQRSCTRRVSILPSPEKPPPRALCLGLRTPQANGPPR